MNKRMGYRESLAWLLANDYHDWLSDNNPTPTITAAFVADCFGFDVDRIRKDLGKKLAEVEKARALLAKVSKADNAA